MRLTVRRVEAEIEDQVAGEGVAQVVEARRRPLAAVEPGDPGRALKRAPLDVAVPERGTPSSRDHPVATRVERRAAPRLAQHLSELRDASSQMSPSSSEMRSPE